MKSINVILLCALCAYAYATPQQYTTKYDTIDLDQILKNDRLTNNYVNCLMERGKCTKEGEELKNLLPDALQTNCSKCSEAQKNGAQKVVRYLIENKPSTWEELEKKYDPTGIYRAKYEKEMREAGVAA